MTPEAPAVPVLAPAGDLDLHTSRELGSRLAELAGEPAGDAVLDLTALGFIDSIGLGVVLKGVNRFSRQGKRLLLVVPPGGNVARLFDFAGTRERVTIAATRDEALGLAAART
jgi:stage II sporulation protein AA (anti-sigma F factor antagonist)